MKQIFLQIISDSLTTTTLTKMKSGNDTNHWMWIAVAELGIIAFLTYRLFKKKFIFFGNRFTDTNTIAKDANVNMEDLMNSINKSGQLYKDLSIKCHPDRFATDEQKMQIANDIFMEISKNKRNYNKLLELKETAQQKLNIVI